MVLVCDVAGIVLAQLPAWIVLAPDVTVIVSAPLPVVIVLPLDAIMAPSNASKFPIPSISSPSPKTKSSDIGPSVMMSSPPAIPLVVMVLAPKPVVIVFTPDVAVIVLAPSPAWIVLSPDVTVIVSAPELEVIVLSPDVAVIVFAPSPS